MLCATCTSCKDSILRLLSAPWEFVLSHYNFMILYTAYQRNITFYSNMDLEQLKTMYSQLVAYSPARTLMIDKLVSTYETQHRNAVDIGKPSVPCTLSSMVTLALGNGVPKRFIHACIANCEFRSYGHMILASFASVEGIRGGTMRYMAILRSQAESGRRDLHTVVATAITGWTARLSRLECTCGTWAQVMDIVSCSTADTETSLMLQSEHRVTEYVCTLLDMRMTLEHPASQATDGSKVDYDYVFEKLLISGL